MPKTKISEFSATPANNTDIDSINIAEGCAPSGINDAIRELMAQLKDFQTGAQGDSFNGPVGTTTAAAGAFTTLSATSTLSVTGAGSIQGLTVGKGAGAVSNNTAVGANALRDNTTGESNTAIGFQALRGTTTGTQNTASGVEALVSTTTGSNNTAVGYKASYTNTTGANNTALGLEALRANTTASNNTAVGYQAMYANTTGTGNIALGHQALQTNTTGNANVALGGSYTGFSPTALSGNTTGSFNIGIGSGALQSNTTASYNTAVGYQAGYSNTTGSYNTLVGYAAGYSISGSGNTLNTFIGQAAGYNVTTGTKNTILGTYNGNQGGLNISTSNNYIVLSDGDGNPRAYRDASGWILSGYVKTSDYFWAAGVGNAGGIYLGSAGSANGQISQASSGSGTITTYIGNAAIATVSDSRLKENIVDSQRNAVEIINQLRVVDHTWNDPSDQCENNRNTRGTWMGLIAQEAQPVIPWLVNKPLSDVDADGNPQYWHMDYGYAVPLLVKAIQELKAEFDAYKASHP